MEPRNVLCIPQVERLFELELVVYRLQLVAAT